jgi:hypothetical protein
MVLAHKAVRDKVLWKIVMATSDEVELFDLGAGQVQPQNLNS